MAESAESTVVYRSTRLRVLVFATALGLALLSILFWVALPANLKAAFTLSQAVTLLVILVFLVGALLVLGSGIVRAEPDVLYFRNGLSKHRYPWSQVDRVVLRPGDAWAQVLLVPQDRAVEEPADLEHRMLMGIQKGDGQYALDAVAELNRRADAHR